MNKLVPVLSQLHDVLRTTNYMNRISLPQIVTVGAQSAGKSSVLEMIIGKDFLPRGSGVVTRRPIVIQMINTPPGTKDAYVFANRPNETYSTENQARQILEQEMVNGAGDNKGISGSAVSLKIMSPDVIDLHLIDLPGITKIPVGDQPDDIESRIKEMIKLYIQNPNTLILAISPANYDIANSDAQKIAREVDPSGVRTMGVLTKLDLLEDESTIQGLFTGKVYPLDLGYFGLKCRNQKDLENNVNMKQAIVNEANFFTNQGHDKPVFLQFKNRMGTQSLQKELSDYLAEQIKKSLPLVRSRLIQMSLEKEKDIKNGGLMFQGNNQDPGSQSALLISLLNKYNKIFTETLRGDGESYDGKEVCGGAKINYIFDNVFKRKIYEIDPYGDMKDDEVLNQIRNISGLNPSQIISDKAFEILVKQQIERFREPTFECLNMVYSEMKRITSKIQVPEFEVFNRLARSISDVMDDILKRCILPTEHMLEQIIKIEKGFINTKHPDFAHQKQLILANKAFSKNSQPQNYNQVITNNHQQNIHSTMQQEDDQEGNFFTKQFGGKDKQQPIRRANSENNSVISGRSEIFNLGSQNDYLRKRDQEDVEIIKQLVNCYLQVVKKNLIDYVSFNILIKLDTKNYYYSVSKRRLNND